MDEEPVEQTTPKAPTAPAAEPAKKKASTKRVVLTILGVLVVGIAALVIFAMQATQGVVNASNKLLDAIQAGDATTAYAQLAPEAKATITSTEFEDTVDRIGSILNTQEKITDRSIASETGKASTGKVTYEIKGTDGVTYTFTVNLEKQSGEWKVLAFDSAKK